MSLLDWLKKSTPIPKPINGTRSKLKIIFPFSLIIFIA